MARAKPTEEERERGKRVGTAVKAVARARDVRIGDLAQVLGMSRQALNQRLRGEVPWRRFELERLAAHLHCSVDDFEDPDLLVRRVGWMHRAA